MTDAEKGEYAQAIWDEFTRRSGRPERIMSCLEWEHVREWMVVKEIPLRIVLRGMADTKGRPTTLGYYAPSVREAYRRWLQVTA